MAHWIIDFWGFGGSYYKCSNCGETYWDILDEIDDEKCPSCNELIDEDENEYFREGRKEN